MPVHNSDDPMQTAALGYLAGLPWGVAPSRSVTWHSLQARGLVNDSVQLTDAGRAAVAELDALNTRPYSAPGMPPGATERAREIAETMPTVGQWPGPDHSPGAAAVLPGITCTIPGHCDGDDTGS